jgi:hypothetical protein
LTAAPAFFCGARRKLACARLGDVFFCRVSDAKLLPIARSLYPQSVASHEPRPGFHGITFCGADRTLTVTPDRLG